MGFDPSACRFVALFKSCIVEALMRPSCILLTIYRFLGVNFDTLFFKCNNDTNLFPDYKLQLLVREDPIHRLSSQFGP
jgi:hypothetical protein